MTANPHFRLENQDLVINIRGTRLVYRLRMDISKKSRKVRRIVICVVVAIIMLVAIVAITGNLSCLELAAPSVGHQTLLIDSVERCGIILEEGGVCSYRNICSLCPRGSAVVQFGKTSVSTIETLDALIVGDQIILSDVSQWGSMDKIPLK